MTSVSSNYNFQSLPHCQPGRVNLAGSARDSPLSFPPHPGTVLFCHCLGLFPGPIPCHREDREAGEGGKSPVEPTGELALAEPSSG